MISDRLKTARELSGLSQAQVADLLGVHRPTISEMEAGRRRVAGEEVSRLSEIYGVSVSWLLGEARPLNADPAVELAARELHRLSQEDLDRVIRVLSVLRTDRSDPAE